MLLVGSAGMVASLVALLVGARLLWQSSGAPQWEGLVEEDPEPCLQDRFELFRASVLSEYELVGAAPAGPETYTHGPLE